MAELDPIAELSKADSLPKPEELDEKELEDEGDDEETEGGEPDDTEDEDMNEDTNKSQQVAITEEDFRKSLDRLGAEASEPVQSRRDELLKKALDGGLDDDEQSELFSLMGGEADGGLSEDVTKGFGDNDTLNKALDVSDFLQEHQTELLKSLATLADRIEERDERQHAFNTVLAKALVDTGNVVADMAARLGVIASQPARAPKSHGAEPMNKAMMNGDQAPQGQQAQLSKSQVLGALDELMEKSVDAGRGGISNSGVDIAIEATKFESHGQLHPKMLAEVQEYIQSRRA